jgi:hypothetical protein
MHPAIRALGTLLRLVGISSPEDTAPHPTEPAKPAGPSSWRSAPPPTPPPTAPPPSTPPAGDLLFEPAHEPSPIGLADDRTRIFQGSPRRP